MSKKLEQMQEYFKNNTLEQIQKDFEGKNLLWIKNYVWSLKVEIYIKKNSIKGKFATSNFIKFVKEVEFNLSQIKTKKEILSQLFD